MTPNTLPSKQGLYDPKNEHDACGIGFIVDIKGRKSHNIIQQALTILINLTHRGGCGAEPDAGDGAGILIQIPHMFFKQVCASANINIPSPGEYGAGMVFLPSDQEKRQYCEDIFQKIVEQEGQQLLGWRTVPVNDISLGTMAKDTKPFIRQVFIKRNGQLKTSIDFERKLYIIRKKAEKLLRYSSNENGKDFYIASLSSRTIVYKGMLTTKQVGQFYTDLNNPLLETALALVHSRYSTNTFPSWERAHPNHYIIHNGEINTLRGNINRMYARQPMLKSELFGDELKKILPVINPDGSDSSMFDNCFEFLVLSGRSLAHSIMMMIPEPWSKNKHISHEKKAFYEYHSSLIEPWDGPAAIAFTDGTKVGSVLDRNGLRPSRYYITRDDMVIMASEVGVLDIPPEQILSKKRLSPGKMLLIDTEEGRIITDKEIKQHISSRYPYQEWLDRNVKNIKDLPKATESFMPDYTTLQQRQKAFGYTYEVLNKILSPMATEGMEPIGSMGIDMPLAVLSQKPKPLYDYFKQLFAQVTNPPIDAIREEIVTGTEIFIGSEGNLVCSQPENNQQIKLNTPIIENSDVEKLRILNTQSHKSITIPVLFNTAQGGSGLEQAMIHLYNEVDQALENGKNIIILSDRLISEDLAPIPSLLAVSGLHHHLLRSSKRSGISIVVESGEPVEVHHFALLIGYGASAINPYLAFETIGSMIKKGTIENIDYKTAKRKYIKACTKGMVKIISKMGISTLQSYQSAQVFEAIGISEKVINEYFTGTVSRIGGISLDIIAHESKLRHDSAYNFYLPDDSLASGGEMQWQKDGEYHLFNPETIHNLQLACRTNNYNLFKEYSSSINNQTQQLCTIRGLLEFKSDNTPIPIEQVESVESLCRRFKTGAMSYGSISKEAHEALAIAMNRIGGKSNTGEGGEDPSRFIKDDSGDSRCSAIKQVASGRFGVTSEYLVNANEIQIKMAQGAKPGEGGQLPGEKVYPWVASTRHSTPGVGLISPPPHHDIYSIEDLAQLIHDLKNANTGARISVKLVSEVGVGTIATGVAKGRADVILISGFDGGTGASPRTSLKHAGLPWELGIAETHQTLLLNNLRDRITIETDGKLMTGRDVAIATLLGAEEFGFATCPLVVLGCVMMRVCNLDTCPVGIATQNPELRKRFNGNPEHVVNFMRFIAQELREIMAQLGFRTLDQMVGKTHKLRASETTGHWKTKGLDLSSILYHPNIPSTVNEFCQIPQDHQLDKCLDYNVLLKICEPALKEGRTVSACIPIQNTNRVVATMLGSEVTRRYGSGGLPEDTIRLNFMGSAGQSFGAFIPKGVTLILEGDSNDYIGKGLSGGKIIVYPPKASCFCDEENIITGNVAFYGATSGEAYIRGKAGERFCVRNSGISAVVEGVGDHGCEYMTGGRVVVLGSTGINFAAGMSGGIAYVLDEAGTFKSKCNVEKVELEYLQDEDEIMEIKNMINRHVEYTGSTYAEQILHCWSTILTKIVKVIPRDYKRMQQKVNYYTMKGLTHKLAVMSAFKSDNQSAIQISRN